MAVDASLSSLLLPLFLCLMFLLAVLEIWQVVEPQWLSLARCLGADYAGSMVGLSG